MEIYTERITGGWLVSAIIKGYRVKSRYYGYTKKEAIKMFKNEEIREK